MASEFQSLIESLTRLALDADARIAELGVRLAPPPTLPASPTLSYEVLWLLCFCLCRCLFTPSHADCGAMRIFFFFFITLGLELRDTKVYGWRQATADVERHRELRVEVKEIERKLEVSLAQNASAHPRVDARERVWPDLA